MRFASDNMTADEVFYLSLCHHLRITLGAAPLPLRICTAQKNFTTFVGMMADSSGSYTGVPSVEVIYVSLLKYLSL